ncbi:TIGD6 [Cordylochernes scorpioides]|uniref:TIGD6 n=1 Tax=Cordylochernes scorpioides TaxID=51811 RepID=A0ABY6KYR7_9ARAC|nr:TIGD6 [Cordylochernes scorpioides]
MTAVIFKKYLHYLDEYFGSENRKVPLILDNCPAHHIPENIQVVFLPPNATAKLQPMDMGIILDINRKYRMSYRSNPSYNRPSETPDIMTNLDWTMSPALHQINHLSITSPPFVTNLTIPYASVEAKEARPVLPKKKEYALHVITREERPTTQDVWIIDSACTSHMTSHGEWIEHKTEDRRSIQVAEEGRHIESASSGLIQATVQARVILETADIHFRENNNVISEEKQSDNNTDTDTYFFIQEDEQQDNHVLSDVDIEEPAPDTMINRQTESSGSDRPQRTRTIPKRFDDYVLATTNETIPKDYDEAIACEDKKHWENAMLEEIQNMYSHQVWELVPRPVNAKHTYQEALGMLMFLAVNTRPDIAYITSKLSQYSRQPKQMHWTAIKRVMRYLRETIDLGVKFERGKTGILKSYTDAS